MSARFIKSISAFAALIALSAINVTANAAINIANGAPVIGGSGSYNGQPFNSGLFPASNVTDGANASPDNNVGTISENSTDGSFWLGHNFATTGYFVLDLGAAYNIGEIELFNTRNGTYRDRGTGNFTISASLATTPGPSGTGLDLLGGVQIVSGTLTSQNYVGASPGATPLVPDVFTATNAGPFQYLRFDALSIGAIGPHPYGLNGIGLNEIRVFEAVAAVPEPAMVLVVAFVGGMGWLLRRRLHNALCGSDA